MMELADRYSRLFGDVPRLTILTLPAQVPFPGPAIIDLLLLLKKQASELCREEQNDTMSDGAHGWRSSLIEMLYRFPFGQGQINDAGPIALHNP